MIIVAIMTMIILYCLGQTLEELLFGDEIDQPQANVVQADDQSDAASSFGIQIEEDEKVHIKVL